MSNRVVTVIFFLIACLSVIAQTDRDHIRRGNRLMRDTLFAKAQVEYQKAIEKDNTNAIAHYNLANALLYQNKAEDAWKEYDTASKFEKNRIRLAKIYHNMGVLMQQAKQYDKAVACYQNSLRNDPTNNQTRYNYALSLYMAKHTPARQDNQDQQQDKNGQNEKKEQQKQEQEKQDKKNEQKQKEESKPDMSKENAEQMLKAAMQDEKSTQEKMQRALQQPQRKHLQKQW
ncbi:MAG: tetratricopeptide repeat protein [Bacteroidaceae bacterium]|nr:tetratricopeptide repeat protein [Bacteroidaceae bacterium]